jgi:hypothetical protein
MGDLKMVGTAFAVPALAASSAPVALPALVDPLPSWSDTDAKAAIIEFVDRVTDSRSQSFVPEDDLIAVFDNEDWESIWTGRQ